MPVFWEMDIFTLTNLHILQICNYYHLNLIKDTFFRVLIGK